MKNDPNSNVKRRAGRKYQFDPQDVSVKFHMVEEFVRERVVNQRNELRQKHIPDRQQRRQLFKRLGEIREAFISPESKDEADVRALSLNSQIVMKSAMKNALKSLLYTIGQAKVALKEPEESEFSTECLTTVEEEMAEKEALEALRELRASAFLAELLEKSKLAVEEQNRSLDEVIAERRRRDEEEAIEEEETLLASDRKLINSGVYRITYKC
ncbi:hypothetical protein BgAZ_110620 [Babesia gibsoni]|uniref:Uncharacterized protein n=1 Tax=Babesia gibsoni TaxID=33632 RepID=A0AAD8PGW2_BABGI|nr:hypothetical protein BgAZ_110620 [Babesia gibsoni]